MSKISSFGEIGFDFGVKPKYIVVGDTQFGDFFQDAKCIGLAYLVSEANTRNIPIGLHFLFENEKPAKKYFDCLLEWVEKSGEDGEAVDLAFIERKDGGYTLAISQEYSRLLRSIVPKYLINKIDALFMTLTQYKRLEQKSDNYVNFKENYTRSEKISISYSILKDQKIIKQSEVYFTKKVFSFYHEELDKEIPAVQSYIRIRNNEHFDKNDFPSPPKQSKEEISERRTKEMKELLPFTMNRLSNLWLTELVKELGTEHDKELVYQAICNLTVFERIKQLEDIDLNGFLSEGGSLRILEYLVSTYESFDSFYPDENFYSKERVLNQMKRDQKELLNNLNNQ